MIIATSDSYAAARDLIDVLELRESRRTARLAEVQQKIDDLQMIAATLQPEPRGEDQ